ncbi:MAG: dTMP kinase [Myxococcota bacterium]|jgi:dTMP kinase
MAKTGKGKKPRGRFIVLEGIDGAGTTTQSRQLVEWLTGRGELAIGTHQPTDGPIGNLIRQILRGRMVATPFDRSTEPVDPAAVALLFAADRLDHIQNVIEPALRSGRHVICDRYVVSSFAYQSLDTDLRFVRQINEKAFSPDLTLFLDVRAEVAMNRIEASRTNKESFEQLGTQKKVAANYRKLLTEYRGSRVVTIDGEDAQHNVSLKIRSEVEALL